MTTERWDDDRLDRLANMVESNARVIQALANVAAEAREEREQLFQRMEQQNAIIVQQQEEIVGLRIETRRTLDILLNQRNQGDNPTA
ncbi:hypothetical protein BCD67_14665 [Oscillatoriales cyanobacterium USR001]|nr:hypothetical protein BCD67_14665 [Oscillatoriales cyanobacterium USR001]